MTWRTVKILVIIAIVAFILINVYLTVVGNSLTPA